MVKVYGINKDGLRCEVNASIKEKNDRVCVLIKKENVDTEFASIIVENGLTSVGADGKGYIFYPTDCAKGVVLTYLNERADAEYTGDISFMAGAGIGGNEKAVFVLIKQGAYDARFKISVKDNVYTLSPEFCLDFDGAEEDLYLEYIKMPNASYSDMARVYRKYQIEERGCVPLKERAKGREALSYAARSLEVRVRMGWKPVPTPVRHQTPDNEPEMKIVCDIKKLGRIIEEMHRQGVENAELCLVGWSEGGHDGRFPQNYPLDPRYGTEEELKSFIKKAEDMGYRVVVHTNSQCAFEIADNWNEAYLSHKRDDDGSIVARIRDEYVCGGGLSGGDPYLLCPMTAYEKYAAVDLPKIREYGFRGLHYIDELTAAVPKKCYHEKHPVSRRSAYEYYRKTAVLSRELFGGFQSEAWIDCMNSDVDYIMYTSFTHNVKKENDLFDEQIPFWQLVYHGIVLSNPTSLTTNYTIKGEDEHLRFIEYGGRPLMYFFSKFGEEKNWMGDIDLVCDTDEEIAKCVEALKRAEEEYKPLMHLQYEFMEEHKKTGDGVYEITYSDGTVITVDYNNMKYDIK